MQNIENGMDDLFRRAAENYPLKKNKGDWESVFKKLSLPNGQELPGNKEKNKDSKKLLIIVLLAIILILTSLLIFNLNTKSHSSGNMAVSLSLKKEFENKNVQKENLVENKAVPKIPGADEKSPGVKRENSNKISEGISFSSFQKGNILSKRTSFLRKSFAKNETGIETNNYPILIPENFDYPKITITDFANEIGKQPTILIDSNPVLSSEKKKAQNFKKSVKENGLYAGIISGPDFSKVKSGDFRKPGFNAGIFLGYQINKKLFAETGFTSGTKYYSSDGQVFHEAGAAMPDGMVVNNLQSYSRVFEIPLKIGYRVYKKNRSSFFVAAGVSAYIMTMEKNNYNVTMNGTEEKMVGIYEKNNVKTPAEFNLSTGWEYHLKGLMNVRIEPYLKLPLQGIGVGKLPVTSAGFQIGIYRMIK